MSEVSELAPELTPEPSREGHDGLVARPVLPANPVAAVAATSPDAPGTPATPPTSSTPTLPLTTPTLPLTTPTLPLIRPTLPPRPTKGATASAPANATSPAPAADPPAPDVPDHDVPVLDGAASDEVDIPARLTAPPLVAPPLVAPPLVTPPLVTPPLVTRPSAPTTGAPLPPPSIETAAPPTSTGPHLGLATSASASSVAGLRLNLQPIDDVAPRAAATDTTDTTAIGVADGSVVDGSVVDGPVVELPVARIDTAPVESVVPLVPSPVAPPVPQLVDAAVEEQVEDALAAAAAKSGDPHLLAAAAHFAAQKQAATLPSVRTRTAKKRQRRTGRYLLLAVVVLGGAATAWFVRDSAFVQKVRGIGYDPEAAPGTVYLRPTPSSVEFELTEFLARQSPTGPESIRSVSRIASNPATGAATIDSTDHVHAVENGVPAELPSESTTGRTVITEDAWYTTESAATDASWETGSIGQYDRGPTGNVFFMYQDVVDHSLRSVRPSSVVARVDGDVTRTTYTWEFAFGDFYESAPQLFQRWNVLQGNADPDSTVTVVLTVDDQGVVWLLDVALELGSVLDHATERGDGLRYPYRYRWELDHMSYEAFVPEVPTNVVGQPATEAADNADIAETAVAGG